MEPSIIKMYGTDATLLGWSLHDAEDQFKAIAALQHTTEAEARLLILKAAIVRSAYLQLEGMMPTGTPGAIDWAVGVANERQAEDGFRKVNEGGHDRCTADACRNPGRPNCPAMIRQ